MTTESAVEAVESVVEAAVETAVEAANERADAAREAARLIAEGAIQRTITDDVEELQEELAECRNELENLRQQVTTLQSQLTETQATLQTVVTLEILTAELAKLSSQPSIPQNSPPTDQTSETPTHQPGEGDAGDHPDQAEAKPKPKRYHLT